MTDAWDGRPENPECDSSGHVLRVDECVDVYRWVAANQWFEDRYGRWLAPVDLVKDGDEYFGQIMLPADLAARDAAVREKALREAAEVCGSRADEWQSIRDDHPSGSIDYCAACEARDTLLRAAAAILALIPQQQEDRTDV